MKNPKIRTRVVHSQTKAAWNVIGKIPGGKYKVARVPYIVCKDDAVSERERVEAFQQAEFISYCFNNSDQIINLLYFAPLR